jgi:hypothetical protein
LGGIIETMNGWKKTGFSKMASWNGSRKTKTERNLKTTCPKCNCRYDISDKEILKHIERSGKLRSKVASLLGCLTGGQTRLDAEGRRQRAIKAVKAREAKRKRRE